MRTSTIYRTALLLALAASPAHALTQEELIAKIQAARLLASARRQIDGRRHHRAGGKGG